MLHVFKQVNVYAKKIVSKSMDSLQKALTTRLRNELSFPSKYYIELITGRLFEWVLLHSNQLLFKTFLEIPVYIKSLVVA